MNGFLYIILDRVAKTVTPPFFSVNDETAKRELVFGSIESGTPPQDLSLYRIAEFKDLNDCHFSLEPSVLHEDCSPSSTEIQALLDWNIELLKMKKEFK